MVFLKPAVILCLKIYFPVSKHKIELENTIYIGQPFVWQCPPLMTGHLKKNGTNYNFLSRDHKSGPIFMFNVILNSGEQKSIFRSICVH